MIAEGGKILVVGGGIVGVLSALELQRRSFDVVLTDPRAPGEGCSFGNAGNISPGAVVPYSMPGTLLDVPKWALDPSGPLAIRLGHLPALTPWLLRWLNASRPDNARRISRAMHAMHAPTFDLYLPLMREIGEPDLITRTGQLYVSRRDNGAQGRMLARELRETAGVPCDHLAGGQLQEVEPALSPAYRSGLLLPGNGNCANPFRLVQVLAAEFVRRSGKILRKALLDIEFSSAGVRSGVLEDGERIGFDALVLSTGAWSNDLTRRFGLTVPLEGERGYHVTLPEPGVRPRLPVINADASFATAPMEMGLRIAGTAEYAGLAAPPNWQRARRLMRLGAEMFPGLQTEGVTEWAGLRPTLPDGLPILDRMPGYPNVILAFGNSHFGLTAAPMMGRLVGELARGEAPSIELSPYRATRFGYRPRANAPAKDAT